MREAKLSGFPSPPNPGLPSAADWPVAHVIRRSILRFLKFAELMFARIGKFHINANAGIFRGEFRHDSRGEAMQDDLRDLSRVRVGEMFKRTIARSQFIEVPPRSSTSPDGVSSAAADRPTMSVTLMSLFLMYQVMPARTKVRRIERKTRRRPSQATSSQNGNCCRNTVGK